MADNDKGLYLPLKINLSDWEKSLAQADADLQKAMKEMRSSISDLKLSYDVKIAGAKAAGDDIKALELENEKLNAIYEAQKKAVESLNKAYQQSTKEKGENAKESQALAQQLVRESKALERTRAQIENKNAAEQQKLAQRQAKEQAEAQRRQLLEQQRLAKEQLRQQAEIQRQQMAEQKKLERDNSLRSQAKDNLISGSLMMVSPQLEGARRTLSGITDSLKIMGGGAATAAKAITGVGLAIGGVTVAYNGLKAVSDGFRDMAEEAAQASDKAYLLAEKLNTSYEEAEKLNAIFTLDGTNAEGFLSAMQKLNKQLNQAGEDGNYASQMLEEFGVKLKRADGTQKNYIEQLKEMAAGYKRAKEAGAGLDFLTTLGSSGTQFAHILNGLDDYIAKTEQLVRAQRVEYDLNHELLTVNGQLTLQQQELTKATGGNFGDSALEAKKQELEYLKERTRLANDPANREMYRQFQEDLKTINTLVIAAQGEIELYTDKLKAAAASIVVAGANSKDFLENVVSGLNANFFTGILRAVQGGAEVTKKALENIDYLELDDLADIEEQEKSDAQEKARRAIETRQQKQEAERKAKEAENQAKKEKEVRERFYKELRDIQATEYEKELNALKDKRDAYIKEGISEVEADKLFAEQKAQIDKRYFDKLNSERQKQVKEAEQAYQKEQEAAKRAREAAISDAESTLKNNLKLARYIQSEQKKGTYNENRAKSYAEQLYLRQQGYRMQDISFLKDFTPERLKGIADARSRLFSDFAPPTQNTNNVTINFDNTVVEDLSTMEKLANKVAEVITPAIEQALKGGTEYGY